MSLVASRSRRRERRLRQRDGQADFPSLSFRLAIVLPLQTGDINFGQERLLKATTHPHRQVKSFFFVSSSETSSKLKLTSSLPSSLVQAQSSSFPPLSREDPSVSSIPQQDTSSGRLLSPHPATVLEMLRSPPSWTWPSDKMDRSSFSSTLQMSTSLMERLGRSYGATRLEVTRESFCLIISL